MPLNHHQRLACTVFDRHVPRRFVVPAAAADHEPLALAERVEGEPAMGAEPLAVSRLDGPRLVAHEARKEVPEGPLADETDPGAVGLVEDRQAGAARTLA